MLGFNRIPRRVTVKGTVPFTRNSCELFDDPSNDRGDSIAECPLRAPAGAVQQWSIPKFTWIDSANGVARRDQCPIDGQLSDLAQSLRLSIEEK
jgi:hypothetical protein